VQGYQPYGTAETGYVVNTVSKKIAEGRIRDESWIIDLYAWVEPPKGSRTVFPAGQPPVTVEAEEKARCSFASRPTRVLLWRIASSPVPRICPSPRSTGSAHETQGNATRPGASSSFL
jgi:hypothetical protein